MMNRSLATLVQSGDLAALRQVLVRGGVAAEELSTALQAAARVGALEAIGLLVWAGAKPSADPNEWSPLHVAVEHGQGAAVAELVKLGADVNQTDHQGWTPLHLAVDVAADGAQQLQARAEIGMIELLLQLGADPSRADRRGLTPRQMAEEWKDVAILEVLRSQDRRCGGSDEIS